jgi:hypothetical protein
MSCGWLSPDGKFFACGINEHIAKAKELFLFDNPERYLERTGWIKITPDYILRNIHNDFCVASEITQAQINWLYDMTQRKETSWMFKDMFKDIMSER